MDWLWMALLALCLIDLERCAGRFISRHLPMLWQSRIDTFGIEYVGMPMLTLWRRLRRR